MSDRPRMKIGGGESPGKAKPINQSLGSDYMVLASYGHVRDLPAKDGSVRPDEDFDMSWEVDAKSAKRLNDIAAAAKGADTLILATDPDREGEAISWPVRAVLKRKKARAGGARGGAKAACFSTAAVEKKPARRSPPPPFTTSTLQQEASRKLGFNARTMQAAQRLYEGIDIGGETVGLITYMRTDGVQTAPEAIGQTRRLIETKYGQSYVPASPRVYTSKAKNAQEAHEAIRPTDLFRTPQDVAAYLDKDQLGLYELIWKRTVASQMESAVLDQVTVDITSGDKTVQLRATGSVVKFNGFLTLYDEGKDEKSDDEERTTILPDTTENQARNPRAALPEHRS